MKKIISLIAVTALLLCVFAGCSTVTPEESVGTSGKPATQTEFSEKTAPAETETDPAETDPPAPVEEWLDASGYMFYDREGANIDPTEEGGDWKLFQYWKGWNDTQIYDSVGNSGGYYVTVEITCSKFRVGFGNGGDNAHTNILIYCDDELMGTYNGTEQFDGIPWMTDEYTVTPGTHTVKVLAGEPLTPETWNGLTFNIVQYVATE